MKKHVTFYNAREFVGHVSEQQHAMAGAVIATLPPLLVFVLLQRQFLKGFAFSTEK